MYDTSYTYQMYYVDTLCTDYIKLLISFSVLHVMMSCINIVYMHLHKSINIYITLYHSIYIYIL